MPDWSYRTVLRPLLFSLGHERARGLATWTLGTIARTPFGPNFIDLLGHMRADERLRTNMGSLELPGPIALGSLIDPSARASGALARFGVGLIEVGPVAEQANNARPDWRVDCDARTVEGSCEPVVALDELERNLRAAPAYAVRIASSDPAEVRRIVRRLEDRASMFIVDAQQPECVRAAQGKRPVFARITQATAAPKDVDGLWVAGRFPQTLEIVKVLRASGATLPIVAEGVTEPQDAKELLDAGARVVVVGPGLVVSGPGLVKRCNEALLSRLAVPPPEGLSLDAARRSWFWAFLLGVAMMLGGALATWIAATRVLLPYDEVLSGMTRAQLARLNPHLLPFMTHDRISLAGTMLSIGIFYAALGWYGIRRGAHWAQVTVIASGAIGFVSFFFFLGFGYFDPFHAFVTAINTEFLLLCLVMQPSPRQPGVPEWRETAAWRRAQWGQLIFVVIGIALTGAGAVISAIGCTFVFVETDLAFMQTTAHQLHQSYEMLYPLVAHDRASLGGMLLANGVTVLLCALWGFRAGARWLWTALALGGNMAFSLATLVHLVVGYHSPLHLTPAMLGWVGWNVALLLTWEWMRKPAFV
jgi:hypothetical protein